MNDDPIQRIPYIVEGADVRTLTLSPFQGFMLSRIDGATPLNEVADSTGASLDQVGSLISLLKSAGILGWVDEREKAEQAGADFVKKSDSIIPTPQRSSRPTQDTQADDLRFIEARKHYSDEDLKEVVDLDNAQKRQILDHYFGMEDWTHYELLGLERTAEKADIRARYFALSKAFHPDSFFGKELGSFKAKMEAVFASLTAAYDVLSKGKKRREYDEYLGLTDQSRAVEASVEAVEKKAVDRESQIPAAPEPPAVTELPSEPPLSQARLPRRKSEAERRAIARELIEKRLKSQRSAGAKPAPAPDKTTTEAPGTKRRDLAASLVTALKGASNLTGGSADALNHIRQARAAVKEEDWLLATNEFRLALSFGETPSLLEEYESARMALATEMSETHKKQGMYEEREGRWRAAALSWLKVVEGRPKSREAKLRAARALLECGQDLQKARELVAVVIEEAPDNRRAVLLLAGIYEAAGMTNSAVTQLELARDMDPSDKTIKDRIRALRALG